MDFDISNFVYLPLLIGIVTVTMTVRQLFTFNNIHAKWITLIVAIFGGIIQFVAHRIDTNEAFPMWKVITTLGVAVISYDYFAKIILDLIAKKNPINPQ